MLFRNLCPILWIRALDYLGCLVLLLQRILDRVCLRLVCCCVMVLMALRGAEMVLHEMCLSWRILASVLDLGLMIREALRKTFNQHTVKWLLDQV